MKPAKKNEFENIDVNELGCLGEQEIDAGVKEVESVGKAQPTTKDEIFASIPHEVKKTYRKIYDGFEFKDMAFDEFCVEMAMLSNPGLMQRDMSRMIDQKHESLARKAGIDHAIKKAQMN